MSREITPIFGLTRSQLRPIVECIAHGETVTSFHITIEHEVHGYCGYSADKVIPTISYKYLDRIDFIFDGRYSATLSIDNTIQLEQ